MKNISDIETDFTVNDIEFEMQITADNYAENIENTDRFGGNKKIEAPAADEMKNPNTKKKTALDTKLLHKFVREKTLRSESNRQFFT